MHCADQHSNSSPAIGACTARTKQALAINKHKTYPITMLAQGFEGSHTFKTHPPTPYKDMLISKHAPETGSYLARRVIRNAVLAFSRARDLRTRGGVAAITLSPVESSGAPGRAVLARRFSARWRRAANGAKPCAALRP